MSTRNKKALIGVSGVETLDAAQTVTMVVPQETVLMLDDRRRVVVPAGTQEIPAEIAGHPYLKAAGAHRYTGARTADAASDAQVPASGDEVAEAGGYATPKRRGRPPGSGRSARVEGE